MTKHRPFPVSLQWRHNEHDGVSNHQRLDWLLNRFVRHRSKKTWKLRATGLCEGNSPVTSEFPAQRASNAENIFIWWRHVAHNEMNASLNGQMRKFFPVMSTLLKVFGVSSTSASDISTTFPKWFWPHAQKKSRIWINWCVVSHTKPNHVL